MPKITTSNRILDARPDRVNYRDRMYQPKLTSLPTNFPDLAFIREKLGDYTELVLDQGEEGACTGFGLAAVINYLLWKKNLEAGNPDKVIPVSPRMLHQMARFYDEWPGEEYEGSSCRGAMKGWYRHGVCSEQLWPYRNPRDKAVFVRPQPGWQQDAATRPLGAYYRVRKESITDMQSALCEVGALYASIKYHDGWDRVGEREARPPLIRVAGKPSGGHAFALVGYMPEGFILQNSWGKDWGYNGFAIISYEDWARHALDAWVAVLGAPMVIGDSHPAAAARSWSRSGLVSIAATPLTTQKKRKSSITRLDPAQAYHHAVVVGNNGHPVNRFIDIENASKAVAETVYELPAKWLKQKKARRVVIFAQSGLTTEAAAIDRIRILAPYFEANAIYPIFLTWRAGFKDTLAGMVDHAVTDYLFPTTAVSRLGLDPTRVGVSMGLDPEEPSALFAGGSQSQESRDQSVEVACQDLMVRPVWMHMKRNAEAAAKTHGALAELVANLQKLKNERRDLQIHLVGHSAGAILLGHLLDAIAPRRMRIATCTLFAPACTVDFACKHFIGAMGKGGVMQKRNFFVEILSDYRERDDVFGPYSKSMLYLVSRGMEDTHNMPILGLEKVWNEDEWPDGDVEPRHIKELKTWRKFCRGGKVSPQSNLLVSGAKHFTVTRAKKRVPASHVDFDRDVGAISRTVERVRGRKLHVTVQDLDS